MVNFFSAQYQIQNNIAKKELQYYHTIVAILVFTIECRPLLQTYTSSSLNPCEFMQIILLHFLLI